jgi:hypothetical protein
MTHQAKGTLHIIDWDEKPYVEWPDGAKLVKADVPATFSGDIEGEGGSQFLMAYTDERTSTFTGLQRVEGSLGGRTGRFVLQITGGYQEGVAQVNWSVIPGSGTDQLKGLRGQGGYTAGPGDYPNIPVSLEYELD